MPVITSSKTKSDKKPVKKPAARSKTAFDLDSGLIDNDDHVEGLRIVISGMEGVGKSSAAAHAPRGLFLCSADDHGIHTLRKAGLVPKTTQIYRDIEDFYDLCNVMEALADPDNDHDRQSVIIDTLTFVQQLMFQACCKARFQDDFSKDGFFAFYAGPQTCMVDPEYFPRFKSACNGLVAAGINVILTGHTVVSKYENPEGSNFDRYTSDLDKRFYKGIAKWADSILFIKPAIDTNQEKREKVKGSGGDMRLVHTEYSAVADAKNRFNLPAVMGPYGSGKDLWSDVWNTIQKSLGNTPVKASTKK